VDLSRLLNDEAQEPLGNGEPRFAAELRAARAGPSPRVAVRLRPFVPIPVDRPWRSWLGGHPRLPDPFTWPQGDGKPFHFVAQIDCSELPTGVWFGAGPRHGWLAFFVGTRKGRVAVEVVRAATLGPERPAPAPWRRDDVQLTYLDAPDDWRFEPPCWPVEVLAQPEGEPGIWRSVFEKGTPEEPNPHAGEVIDLARAEYQPHDWEALRALLHVMRRRVAERRKTLAGIASTTVGGPNASPSSEASRSAAATVAAAQEKLAEVDALDAALGAMLEAVTAARASDAPYAWEDWRGQVEGVLARNLVDARRVLRNWNELRSALAARAYAANPAAPALPAPVLAYFLERWRYDARFEIACMGGTNHGYTDIVDPDDEDRTALLLELPDSTLFGWSWGDVEDLVVAIPMDALRRGAFDEVVTGVTNGRR